jgi:GR25 family glycosyltransferase involved in LPS biosynthesis
MIIDWLKHPGKYFSGKANKVKPTWAAIVAAEDVRAEADCSGRRFSIGSRPVIRWIKGDGLDDMITRAAIGQATRLFGSEVDYCICTQGIDADRVRSILEWASQPVEWWPVSEEDNPQLAQLLTDAGCEPNNFGYWWKWFPERVRPDAPEWILDGDMVITGKPDWFQKWAEGSDVVRISQDDAEDPHIYGNYSSQVNLSLMLYSGLVSLPPKCNFMPQIVDVLTIQPLLIGHDGKKDMSEQGVIAAAFQRLNPIPIPLYEFPFCRAFQDYIDFGLQGDQGLAWGYHFGNSFIMKNPHFERLTANEIIFSKHESSLIEKFQWLGGHGQWGIPGWTITDGCAKIILDFAVDFKGKHVLEMGTSRGRLTAMLANLGCKVTTIDHIDRHARQNLQNLTVEVIIDDAIHFLETNNQNFDLIICDLHGNSAAEWKQYSKTFMRRVLNGSTLIISNALLGEIPEWHQETGVQWFLKQIPKTWQVQIFNQYKPGVAIVQKSKTSNDFDNHSFIERHLVITFLKLQAFKTKGIRQIWLWTKLFLIIRIIKQSNLFDKKYYLQNNPDVKSSGMSAFKHYLLFGGFEGRNPSDKFNSKFYLDTYPDVLKSGMNPLVHFLDFGINENRNPVNPKLAGQPKEPLIVENPSNIQKVTYTYILDVTYSNEIKSFILENNGNTEFINTYFDNIYVINLRRRQNKLNDTLSILKKLNIRAEIIEAVDGYESPNIDEYHIYQSLPLGMSNAHPRELKLNRKLIYSPGVWGHLKSNRLIISDAIAKCYKKILILEDDVIFINNFHKEFQKFTQLISNKNWKFLYLGASQNCWKIPECLVYPDANILDYRSDQPYYHPVRTHGSFAIGIDSTQFKSVNENIDKMNCAFDSSYHNIYNQCIEECFVAQPNLIVSDVFLSDNRTNRSFKDQNIMAETYKWNMSEYDYQVQKK